MRSRFVSAALAAFVAASPVAFAGYMSIRKPIPAFEKVLEKGGVLRGRTTLDGKPVIASFGVTKKYNGSTYAYDLNFYVAKDHSAPPLKHIVVDLRAEKEIVPTGPQQLFLDMRGYPSHSKTTWSFQLAPDGMVTGLLVKKEGTLGVGALEFHVPLITPLQDTFNRLHGAE